MIDAPRVMRGADARLQKEGAMEDDSLESAREGGNKTNRALDFVVLCLLIAASLGPGLLSFVILVGQVSHAGLRRF